MTEILFIKDRDQRRACNLRTNTHIFLSIKKIFSPQILMNYISVYNGYKKIILKLILNNPVQKIKVFRIKTHSPHEYLILIVCCTNKNNLPHIQNWDSKIYIEEYRCIKTEIMRRKQN